MLSKRQGGKHYEKDDHPPQLSEGRWRFCRCSGPGCLRRFRFVYCRRKVTLVCPWGVGGGADGTLRPLQPVLEPILGVPVEIVNVEGAGGANGIDFTCKQPADGYTYVLGTQSHIMLDLQKILPVDFKKELRPVAKLVHSINIIASSKKAQEGKYSNFTEFVDYAKAHPQELTCGMLTATGADSVALKQTLAGGLGCDITEVEQYVKVVNYSSGSELSSAMVGGHININITGADEIMGLIQSGDIVPLISISENRMSTLPDLECPGELGIDSYVGTWRGILCRTDTRPERSMEHPRLSGVPEECLLPRPSRLRRR
ncbi:MAG: hypothetical protein BHW25_06780 [Faecalibacterium sp. CAG:82-related_59_9]|nr:MAG: hypothetical protein BHW25_06780 [Faecalibacterium sp. CAG:82-related_59_9]